MSHWAEYYQDAGGIRYFIDHLWIHREWIEAVLSRKPKRILETGCGSGTLSIFLSQMGLDVTAIDADERVLEIAAKNNAELGGRVRFLKADGFHLPFKPGEFDLAVSQGVLEHFDAQKARDFLAESLRVSKEATFSVPNRFYKVRDYGDEKLLTRSEWNGILKPFRVLELRDYFMIRTKRNFLRKLPVMTYAVVSSGT